MGWPSAGELNFKFNPKGATVLNEFPYKFITIIVDARVLGVLDIFHFCSINGRCHSG